MCNDVNSDNLCTVKHHIGVHTHCSLPFIQQHIHYHLLISDLSLLKYTVACDLTYFIAAPLIRCCSTRQTSYNGSTVAP